jgi:hypothetical protein
VNPNGEPWRMILISWAFTMVVVAMMLTFVGAIVTSLIVALLEIVRWVRKRWRGKMTPLEAREWLDAACSHEDGNDGRRCWRCLLELLK